LLNGMDSSSQLDSVDNDPQALAIAQRHLGGDPRATLHLANGAEFLEQEQSHFDFIFADAWPGKFTHLDLALSKLRAGGIYLVDDLLPQTNWPMIMPPKYRH
jgi:predicted O-methyltransferase YrrM